MWRLVIITFAALCFAFYELSGGDEFDPQTDDEIASNILPANIQEAMAMADASGDEAKEVASDSEDGDAAPIETANATAPVSSDAETEIASSAALMEQIRMSTGSQTAASITFVDKAVANTAPAAEAFVQLAAYQRDNANQPIEELSPQVAPETAPAGKEAFFAAIETSGQAGENEFKSGTEIDQFWAQVEAISKSVETRREALARLTPTDEVARFVSPIYNGADSELRVVNGNRVNMRQGPGTSHSVIAQLDEGQQVEIIQDPGTGWVKLRALEDDDQIGWIAGSLLRSVSE